MSPAAPSSRTRVLVVDDSAVARDLIERGLSRDPSIEVVGKAADVYSARDKIVFLKPDVVTLDVEMPRMDGIEFLKRLIPQYPLPVIVVSAVTAEGSSKALEALDAGAVAVVPKPSSSGGPAAFQDMVTELADRIKEASKVRIRGPRPAAPVHPLPKSGIEWKGGPSSRTIIALGASTGGTTALRTVIHDFPRNSPGTLVVQHMPPVFTRMFAESLNRESAVEVREARDGDAVRDGLVLVAPGDLHMSLERTGDGWKVRCQGGLKVSGHRPSVDVLLRSVAQAAGSRAVGMVLTGMGRDGAEGLLAMRRAGSVCLAQDEGSSVVFGMPKEAWECGAAERLVPLDAAAKTLLEQAARISEGRVHGN